MGRKDKALYTVITRSAMLLNMVTTDGHGHRCVYAVLTTIIMYSCLRMGNFVFLITAARNTK